MDAWKQLSDLRDKYTTQVFVRDDLRVTAKALDRCVEFALGDYSKPHPMFGNDMPIWRITNRNVITMRELAKALNDACDFVDECNPEWAERGKRA